MGRFSSLNQWDIDWAFGQGESRKRLTPGQAAIANGGASAGVAGVGWRIR